MSCEGHPVHKTYHFPYVVFDCAKILDLKWKYVRNGFIYLEKTKTKNKREIPVNDDLARVFKEIRKEEGLTSDYILTYAKRLISRVDRAFKGALDRAGIEDFKFYDLRYTFASHLVMRGPHSKKFRSYQDIRP